MSVCAGVPHTGLMSTEQWGLGRVCDPPWGHLLSGVGESRAWRAPRGALAGDGRQEGTWQIRSDFWKNPTEGDKESVPQGHRAR